MSYTLLIVESPAKCKKIEDYLGNGYKCMASFGHIREFKNGLINLKNYEAGSMHGGKLAVQYIPFLFF